MLIQSGVAGIPATAEREMVRLTFFCLQPIEGFVVSEVVDSNGRYMSIGHWVGITHVSGGVSLYATGTPIGF